MEVQWVKIDVDMFSNHKIKHIRHLPDGDKIILIWVMLLTLAGRCNSGGLIFLTEKIPYTAKSLADELCFEENTVRLALKALTEMEMISMMDGYLVIDDWENHQNIDGLEKIREQTKKRVAKYRDRQKSLLLGGKKICAYCGGSGDTIDHVIPKSKGGLDVPENLVPCCLSCNMEKTNRDVASFLNERLALGKQVDIEGISNNPVLQRYIRFDPEMSRFVTENVTLRNATDIEEDIDIKNKNNNPPYNPPLGGSSKGKGILQEFAGDDKDLLNALKEFNEFRTKVKKPLTDGAKKRLVSTLQKFPREQWIDILHQSIDHGWLTVYELHEEGGDYGRSKASGNGYSNRIDKLEAERREREKKYEGINFYDN